MAITLNCILILLCAALAGSTAIPPRTTSPYLTTSNLTTSAQTTDTYVHSASNAAFKSIKTATRELVGHNALMHIRYAAHDRLPTPLYRHVIQTSLRLADEMVEWEGEHAPFPDRYVHIEGDVLLMADHAHHSSSQDLTWGILREALEMVEQFMRSRPFHLEAEILGGLAGRGFPIGEIVVRRRPLEAGWGENVTMA